MKPSPLILRIAGGAVLTLLLLISFAHPLLTQGECTALIAVSQLGKPYVFGAEGDDAYDCSGLTKVACACFGVELIHSAKYVAYDSAYAEVTDTDRLIAGDLVFFDTMRDSDPYDHVGIWLGANRFVHASSSAGEVVISAFDEKWQACYSGARRIIEPYSLEALNALVRKHRL